jgi:predicted ATPase
MMAELLERVDLLAQLELARAEGGRLVFVGGEAGVGKTSLVRTFSQRVTNRVLHGFCHCGAAHGSQRIYRQLDVRHRYDIVHRIPERMRSQAGILGSKAMENSSARCDSRTSAKSKRGAPI